MSISVAIIARNSEDVIERCLESVKDANEIIVVDTGSDTEATKDIARRYTEHVYDYWGCNEGGKRDGLLMDFSAARNEALRYCTMSHVLTIDTDEVLETPMERLKAYSQGKGAAVSFRCVSALTGEEHRQPRLYLNDPMVKWHRPVHNFINARGEYSDDFLITYYTNNQKKKDADRTMRILKRYVEKNKDNAREMYYLGKEYHKRRDYKRAYDMFKAYVQKSKFPGEKADAFVMMARSAVGLGRYTDAVNAAMAAVNMNPMFKEALELAGDMSDDINRLKFRHLAKSATNADVLFIRPDKRRVVTILSKDDKRMLASEIRKASNGRIDIEAIPREFALTIGIPTIRDRIKSSDIIHSMDEVKDKYFGILLPEDKILYYNETDVTKIIEMYDKCL